MDERSQKICNRIYSQHQEALELIFEYKQDDLSVMSELNSEAITILEKEGLIISNSNYSGKSIISFETMEMNKVFSKLPNDYRGGWEKHNAYCFEISNKNSKSSGNIRLIFTSKIDPESRLVLEKALSYYEIRNKNSKWKWWSIGNWKINKVNQNFVKNIIVTLGEEERKVVVKEIADSLRKQLVNINDYCKGLMTKYIELG